ncbi:BTAD domain-containing putative transcriptional regulator [Streptomyces sp. NPDC048604]|uniref:AfsR/SARP family transcriptional regulator n=1 Tax=Streptomyces sp. NPDC048604 TaxID=3365578 RepID=UPI00371B7C2E
MRFGVLGPLGVWTADGRPVRIPELKVRALLACLLVHRGRPVSADRLVEDLWGERLPGNPAGALQHKVWQLRRALEAVEPGGRDLVVSQGQAYRLLVAADAVDAGRFEELTARARAAGDPRARAGLLADALAEWRGPAYADFADDEFTRPARDRLEEQRLTALEEQAEARIDLGEHALVADELGEPVALHPLRERLRAAHLRALYLAGRQSAALAGYAELRTRLAEELGLDPSPDLAALHRAILTQDPTLAGGASPGTGAVRPATLAAAPSARSGSSAPTVPSVPTPPTPPTVSAVPTPPIPSTAPTPLIGREEAIGELAELLGVHRLVTLTGSGGVGKTRLALTVAARLGDRFPGGVRFAELAALGPGPAPAHDGAPPGRPSDVYEALASLFGVRDDVAVPPGQAPPTPADRLAQAIGGQPALLVLDNCEHVGEAVAALAEELLRVLPELRILATSQLPLGLAGEYLREVEPLRRPEPSAVLSPRELLRFGAVELFVARASAAAPNFVLDESTAGAVASICRRLGGVPLALEMAAKRVRALGVRELDARLDDRLQLLTAGSRSAPARQRTLRAVIDWSWELLGPRERAVLRRLAVHADGCTLAAAEETCAGDDFDRFEVLDLLARLVDCSLVVMADGDDGPRYRMLESVAAYGREQLREAGEQEDLERRHRRYYTEFAERAEGPLRGHGQREWLRRLDTEYPNLRAALDGAVRAGDAACALRLANALTWYWYLRGRAGEAQRSLSAALSLTAGTPDAAAARATAWRGGFTLALGGSADPLAEYRAALAPYERVDDAPARARAEWFLGGNLYGIGDLGPSEELMDRALAAFRSLGDRWGTAAALSSRAFHAKRRGHTAAMRRDGEQSLELFRELGDRWGQLQAMVPLETLAELDGDYARAARLYRDGLRIAEDLGLWPQVSFHLAGIGRIALLNRDYARAREFHERARRLAVERADRFGELFAEIGLGMGARREGDLDGAEAHMRSVLALHRRMRYEVGLAALVLAELGFCAELRGDAAGARELQLEGYEAARSTGDPRAVALALEGLAGAQALAGHPDHAARLLGAAEAARLSVGVPLPEAERFDVDRVGAAARQALGPSAYGTEHAHGATLAVAELLAHPSLPRGTQTCDGGRAQPAAWAV